MNKFNLKREAVAPEVFCKKDLKKCPKFIGKHLRQSLFLIKLQVSSLLLYLKRNLARVFSCEFSESFRNTCFTEHLMWLHLWVMSSMSRRIQNPVKHLWWSFLRIANGYELRKLPNYATEVFLKNVAKFQGKHLS